jgi:hypothetical protein
VNLAAPQFASSIHFPTDGSVERHLRSWHVLSRKQKKELKVLVSMPDARIDLTDIPEITDWSRAIIGKFYRASKKPSRQRRFP